MLGRQRQFLGSGRRGRGWFGNVYVADAANNEIRESESGRAVITLAGSTSAGTTDGTGTIATFNNPQASSDASGMCMWRLGNNKIRMITKFPKRSGDHLGRFAKSFLARRCRRPSLMRRPMCRASLFIHRGGYRAERRRSDLERDLHAHRHDGVHRRDRRQTLSVVSANTPSWRDCSPWCWAGGRFRGAAAYAAAMSAGYTHSQVYGD